MKKKIKVVLIQRIFASYRKIIYDELSEFLDFKVFSTERKTGITKAKTTYSQRIRQFKYAKKETNTFLFVWRKLLKENPDVIIHEFAIGILSLPLTLLIARLLRKKFILWSHGYDRKIGFAPSKRFGDKYRLWLMNKADSIILYGQEDKKLLSLYISPDKIFIAQNTLDTIGHTKFKNELMSSDMNLIKQKYCFKTKYNLITIGRLYKEKKSNLIIEVFEQIDLLMPELCSMHFVGDGEHLQDLKEMVAQRKLQEKILFHGAIYDDTITGEMLFASDMMIMAGPVGLSVVHAFCYDCPVIAFNQKGHGPEIEYITDGKTGFIVDDFSIKNMSKIIVDYLIKQNIQSTMKKNIQVKIEIDLNINRMVEGVVNAVNYTYQ